MPKKKTVTEPKGNTISNCNFTGVNWDSTAVKTVQTIADGLVQNAKGLTALAELLKSQNVEIEAMIKMECPKI